MELLHKHFDTALESPNGIKKLRELILTLAMQGKLVPQDPNDQPASELLKEIQAEKERLIDLKKLKKGQLTEDTKTIFDPSSIPKLWELVKAEDIFFITKLAGFEYTKYIELKENGQVPVIRAQNVRKMQLDLTNILYIDLETSLLLERCSLSKPALLVTFIGAGIGDVALFNEQKRWHLAPNVAKMELFENCDHMINLKFINYFLISPYGRKEIFKHLKSTAQPSISMGTIRDIDLPLPPLAEQKRIVAKIEELMALCDKLEAQRKTRSEKIVEVHRATIHKLLETPNTASSLSGFAPSCEPSSLKFSSSFDFLYSHFNPLYSVKENITELKKAILTLAMQGRLVKQDPKDQPASELLKEIQAEKKRLIAEGKIKKQKELPPINKDELSYDVPEGWLWTRLGDFIFLEMGQSPDSKSYNQVGKGIPFFQGKADFGKIFPTPRYWCTSPIKIAFKNDILLSVRAPVGPTNISNIDCCIGRGLAALRPINNTESEFINYLMINFRSSLEEKATGTTFVAVSKIQVENLLIPLPPLAEQKRIVAKIDELMALCDKLENQIDFATDKQTALFDAVLAAV